MWCRRLYTCCSVHLLLLSTLLTFTQWPIRQVDAQFSVDQMRVVAQSNNETNFQQTLKRILKPRIVGTASHDEVKRYIVEQLNQLHFDVELDEFSGKTPHFGRLKFSNIIAKLNPTADKYLTLACHYDSKYFREHAFVGAVDSAVPCAMMLNLAKTTESALDLLKNNTDLSLMLIFFDGEEAFRKWSAADSLYGSRHLASKWTTMPYVSKTLAKSMREIDRIQLMVLLDLIGGENPKFYSFFDNTKNYHRRLSNIESSLRKSRLLLKDPKSNQMFIDKVALNRIEDDHLPFLKRNIPILHLIPIPFPKHWHKPEDNEINLSSKTIKNINMIFRVFMLEYLTYCNSKYGKSLNNCLD
ncbi:glutaminyl-peptide cyclotransferase-like [Toxorhynchites rutilus septentrionalis]|uniref:glutaminyl-peptide cyclotransferase-like n=1 Tax=Toxorhynchites rutilus septentrionalis TaxID=329112 RepID=UPI00247B0F7B|nr:glutaminyl-peptide cyclotransferase-like [Toxorhynchites rutilus septentrionalis]